MPKLRVLLLALLALLLAAAPAAATFGITPDPHFNGGAVFTKTGDSTYYGAEAALQSDGKLVVLSDIAGTSSSDVIVTRLLEDGTPDPDFGTDGERTFTWPVSLYAEGIAVQPDGKIAVIGQYTYASNPPQSFFLRLNPDGSNDTAGFNGGFLSVGSSDSPNSIAIMRDSSGEYTVVAGGTNFGSSPSRASLIRAKGGFPDTDFNSNLTAFTSLFPTADVDVARLQTQPDGKLLVALHVEEAIAVVRLNQDGTLDTTFNSVGYRTLEPPAGSSSLDARSLQVLRDGRIVVGGKVQTGSRGSAFVQALTAGGLPDTSFNAGALTPVNFGPNLNNAEVTAISENANGYLVAAGEAEDMAGSVATALAMISPLGHQTQAIPGGYATHHFSGGESGDILRSANFRPDGRLIVTGRRLSGGFYVAAFAADAAPTVAITAPANGLKTTASNVALAYAYSDDSTASLECTAPSGSQVALAHGLNTLVVSCVDGSGNTASASTTVQRLFTFKVSSPKGKRVTRKKFKTISGSAAVAPKGTKIALQRIDKKLLSKKKRCLWLRNNKASFKSVKAGKGKKCDKPVKLKTKVKGKRFSYTLKKKYFLPKGNYKLTVSASGAADKVVNFRVK